MPFLRNEHNQMIRKDGSVVERAGKGRSAGPRKTRMEGGWISHLKVDRILGGAGPLRDEYEKLLDDPNTLLKDLQAWFAGKGHHLNKTAINRHRHRHHEQFQRVREVAKTAAAFNELVRGGQGGAGAMVEASQGCFEMVVMEKLFEIKNDPRLETGEFQAWGKLLRDATTNRRSVEQLRDDYERKVARSVKVGETAAKNGATGKDVVIRMREILGV